MQYTFETAYNQKALSVMARCIRKTARKARSKRSHILGWAIAALAILIPFASGEDGFVIDFRKIVTWAVAAVMILTLIFEDQINGFFAGKRLLKGTEKARSSFDTEKTDVFISETAVGRSEFSYDKILLIAETDGYFVFVFSASHAQIYDKSSLSGGTVREFRSFISERTNKPVVAC